MNSAIDVGSGGQDNVYGTGKLNVQVQLASLSISKLGIGGGTVTAMGINCGSDCSETFNLGTSITLTATPGTDSTFAGWSGGSCSGTEQCVVTLNSNTTITATFALNSYALTINTSGTGSGTVTGAGTYNHGTTATVTATAYTGAAFTGWTGDCSGSNSSTTTLMASTKTCVANFSLISYALTVNTSGTGSGTVIGAGNYSHGTNATVTATPSTGSTFAGWSGDCSGPNSSTTPLMTSAKTCTANFSLNTYSLTVNTSGTGSGTVTGAGNYNHGTAVTVTATPLTGSAFMGWTGDCSGTETCALTMDSDKSVSAIFSDSPAQNQYSLIVLLDGEGSGTVAGLPLGIDCDDSDSAVCEDLYDEGATVKLAASAKSGSKFTGWSGYAPCEGKATPVCTVTMDDNYEITAAFEVSQTPQYMISVTKGGHGSGKVISTPKGLIKAINCGYDCTEDSAEYGKNKPVILKAVAAKGSKFLGWDDDCIGLKTTCKISKMDSDKAITATFGQPDVSVSDESLVFGEISKGQTETTTFSISNDGDTALKISSMKLGGSGAKMFKVVNSDTGRAVSKATIASGKRLNIEIRFRPTATGQKSASLLIKSDDLDRPTVTVQLSGTGK